MGILNCLLRIINAYANMIRKDDRSMSNKKPAALTAGFGELIVSFVACLVFETFRTHFFVIVLLGQ